MRKVTHKITRFVEDFNDGETPKEMLDVLAIQLTKRDIKFNGVFIEMKSGTAYVWKEEKK